MFTVHCKLFNCLNDLVNSVKRSHANKNDNIINIQMPY